MASSKSNRKNLKWLEIVIAFVAAIVTALIGKYFGSNNFLSDAFVGFMLPYVIITPFQINGKSVETTHDLEDALQNLKNTNQKTYELYSTEVKVLTKSINESCHSLIYNCSYKPNMELYRAVCSKLMSSFSGEAEHDYFYATAECSRDSINWFFDKYNLAGEFLPLLNQKCIAKEITNFRRLFIYDDIDLENPVFYFLVHLHNKLKTDHLNDYCEFDFKFITSKAYRNLIKEEFISDEMGVWGTHCVFIQKNDSSPKGYCFEEKQISKHKRVFENIWKNISSTSFDKLNLDVSKLVSKNEFESEILRVINKINSGEDSNTISTNTKDKDLSLLDIADIQEWVQGKYPLLSTPVNIGI